MDCTARDLTLDEALADPVIGAVLAADRVDRGGFESLLRRTARRLDGARGPVARSAASDDAHRRRVPPAGDLCAW